jgi:hypothetical protein
LAAALAVLNGAGRGHAQWTRRLDLVHGAFDQHRAPDAIVHAPPGFDPRGPLHLVVFLHGFRGCAEVLASSAPAVPCRPGDPPHRGWGLIDRHDEAGTPTLLLIAQLAFFRRDGSPGRWARPGAFRAFLDEALASLEPELGRRRTVDDLASLTILAHSAAFETSLWLIRVGGVEIRNLVLFDALYAGGRAFLAWVLGEPGRRLISIHGAHGATADRNRDLARLARAALAERAAAVGTRISDAREHAVTIVQTDAPHGEVPARHLAEVLRVLFAPPP